MLNILLIISWILLLIRLNYQSLLYFQQNRYESKRYFLWMKNNLFRIFNKSYIITMCFSFLIIFILKNDLVFICLWLLYSFIALFLEIKRKYIKPLVFTRRVKTQVFTMIILESIIFFTFKNIYSLMLVEPLVWILVYLMNIINFPLEKIIANNYLNQAKRILGRGNFKIIGITGSYGKTSTKHAVFSVLSEKYYSYMTPASFNTPMGITRCIREELKNIHEVFICEMGADKVGDIKELMDFVKPQIGVVTSIGPQHLATFKNLDNIIKEKMKIVELLPEDGVAVINIDNEFIKNYQIRNKCLVRTISLLDSSADYYIYDIKSDKTGSEFKMCLRKQEVTFKTKLLGKHNISNCLIAIALGDILGMNYKQIYEGVKKQEYVPHRLEMKKINGFTFIDNAFNSNPVSSKLSIDTLSLMKDKKIVITPGFIDLGDKEDYYNYEFGKYMSDKVDEIYLVGFNKTKQIQKALTDSGASEKVKVFETVKEAIIHVYKTQQAQDTVILLENDLPDAFSN